MEKIALVSADAALEHDEDMPLLVEACRGAGIYPTVVSWDARHVDWQSFDVVVLRSPWDYTERLPEFLAWCASCASDCNLFNPLPILRWNTDKIYLRDLQRAGVATVPTTFVAPAADPQTALNGFLAAHPADAFVIKPTVSAGARDTRRHLRGDVDTAVIHLRQLLDAGRAAMLQPYLDRIDSAGETALVYFDGHFSHAARKAALLDPNQAGLDHPNASGQIDAREAAADERALAEAALAATARILELAEAPVYARVDLIRDDSGMPRILELELTEPALFLGHAPHAAVRFATALQQRLCAAQLAATNSRKT